MDRSSSSESGDEWLSPAQPLIAPSARHSSPSVASSASVSSSNSSSSAADDGVSDVPHAARNEIASSIDPENRSARNKYIGFKRKPVSEDDYQMLGQQRQDRTYSDSDNEYENEVFVRSRDREGRGILDMNVHMDGEWGRRSLVDSFKGPGQLESLITWAHMGATSGISSSDPGTEDEIDNPLSRLSNDPLPLSYLNHLILQAGRIPEFQEALVEKFDTSAMVAIGMILEDILTASLLPLAGCHVLRCRQLESKPTVDETLLAPPSEIKVNHPISNQPIKFDPRNLSDDESAFVAWTLPPEEAILQAARQGTLPDTGIPLLRDPVRSLANPSSDNFERVLGQDVIRRLFAKSNDKDENFLSCNKDLLDIFLARRRYKRKRMELPVEPSCVVQQRRTEIKLADASEVPGDYDKANDPPSM